MRRYEDVTAAKRKLVSALKHVPGFVGAGIGRGVGGDFVVQVYLTLEFAGEVPAVVDGVPVEGKLTDAPTAGA